MIPEHPPEQAGIISMLVQLMTAIRKSSRADKPNYHLKYFSLLSEVKVSLLRIGVLMDITTQLMLGIMASSIGTGYFVYGKRQQRFMAIVSGIALCSYPYFVSNIYLFIVLSVLLIALPFVLRF